MRTAFIHFAFSPPPACVAVHPVGLLRGRPSSLRPSPPPRPNRHSVPAAVPLSAFPGICAPPSAPSRLAPGAIWSAVAGFTLTPPDCSSTIPIVAVLSSPCCISVGGTARATGRLCADGAFTWQARGRCPPCRVPHLPTVCCPALPYHTSLVFFLFLRFSPSYRSMQGGSMGRCRGRTPTSASDVSVKAPSSSA